MHDALVQPRAKTFDISGGQRTHDSYRNRTTWGTAARDLLQAYRAYFAAELLVKGNLTSLEALDTYYVHKFQQTLVLALWHHC